jgi:predicted DCC family thiol-disulfide oxidoreductase YuxK
VSLSSIPALTVPAKAVARFAVRPVRSLARVRPPAIADPSALSPGDPPPTDGRLLLLFDGGCGICLHARDVFARIDGGRHFTHDRIARHDQGLLANVPEQERYESWHVVHPDGRLESGSDGLAAVVAELPGGRIPSWLMRRFPSLPDRGYRWFAANRGWISRGSGLINHPERDPREQLSSPRHDEVVASG